MTGLWRALNLCALLLILVACSHTPADVEESAVVRKPDAASKYSASSREVTAAKTASGQQHIVEKGDTLYSIAFRYSMDFKTLAALNGIRDPYTIYPGQVLTIKSRGVPVVAKPKATAPAPVPVESKPATTASKPATPESKPAASSKPVPVSEPKVTAQPVKAATPVEPEPVQISVAPAATRVVGGGSWRWPAQGKLLGRFTSSGVGPKGIAVGGNSGDPVGAARDGKVVYTGSGLVGYGQLVIIKHDEVYLSAYAHNSKVLVKEGDKVKAGQKIAEMGSTGTDRTQLHFEVRRNGDPVDPLSVLPTL